MNFYEQVYTIVRQIPTGEVTTYGRIARMLDNPRASRAVGYAMRALKGTSPEYDDVPWFRVLHSTGEVRTNASHHAQERQAALLRAEGIDVSENHHVNLEIYLWDGLAPPEVDHLINQR